MSLKPSRVRLIVPGCRTFSRGAEKPQSIRCRPKPFTVDRALGEPDIRISGLLIKIPLLRSFKTTRTLEDHILNAANIIEIQAVPNIRFTPTLPTISMPRFPSPSASALIKRASNLVCPEFVLITAKFLPPCMIDFPYKCMCICPVE